jgi:Helix-turn-helix domain
MPTEKDLTPRTSEVRDPSIPPVSVNSTVASSQEHFVDASVAAEYLDCSRKHILRLSRHGVIPAHAISFGRRITWRYLLAELRAWVLSNSVPVSVATSIESGRRMAGGSPRKGGR